MRIYTIGHSTRTADEFLALLKAHGIHRLVDVRRYPGSRRHPQFSREALSAQLEAAWIAYVHAAELGWRRNAAPDSRNDAWRTSRAPPASGGTGFAASDIHARGVGAAPVGRLPS